MHGWDSYSDAFTKIIEEFKPKLIIEVGTWKGCSAINMARLCLQHYDDFEIVCVDTWLGSVEHWEGSSVGNWQETFEEGRPIIYHQFLSNVMQEGLTDYITPFPIDSVNAVEFFRKKQIQPDMVYIDAGHEYYSVSVDLFSYADILRPGGVLLGDDWFYPPIKKAATEIFGADKIIELSHSKFQWIK